MLFQVADNFFELTYKMTLFRVLLMDFLGINGPLGARTSRFWSPESGLERLVRGTLA